MTMQLEEARKRVQICNGHIEPKQIAPDKWVCDNCGVSAIRHKKNASGFRHYFDSGNEKPCSTCKEVKHITDFYYREGALDNRYSYCKGCARDSTARREEKLQLDGRTRHIWLPSDVYNGVQQVKGGQTFRDFVVVAVRKEVEARARAIMQQRAYEQAKKNARTREPL